MLVICRAVVRSPEKYKETFAEVPNSGKIELVPGDVTDPSSLNAALSGVDGGVIFAASGTTYFSAKAVDYQVGFPSSNPHLYFRSVRE